MAQKTRSTAEETTAQQGNTLPPIKRCRCLRMLAGIAAIEQAPQD